MQTQIFSIPLIVVAVTGGGSANGARDQEMVEC
jgi:hypothetical protein